MFSSFVPFKDRIEAGQKLARVLLSRAFVDPILLALPRGGVPLAFEVAQIFNSTFDVLITRKIGAPGHQEFGLGAICEDEVPRFNPEMNVEQEGVEEIIKDEIQELRRRVTYYRGGRKLPSFKGQTVILIDDGLATGVSALAAGIFLRQQKPFKLVLAVPVCPQDISPAVAGPFNEIICLHRPQDFTAVGLWYKEFPQVQDSEVMSLLECQSTE